MNTKKIKLKKVSNKIGQNENCNFISNPYEFEINQSQNWVISEKLSPHFCLSTSIVKLKIISQKFRTISANLPI
jgi:hypothetical protein